MLTFFDYLRQRAFESVLAGAREALELLESQMEHDEPSNHEPKVPAPRVGAQVGQAAKDAESDRPQEDPAKDDGDLLPAPRRRGAPNSRRKERG